MKYGKSLELPRTLLFCHAQMQFQILPVYPQASLLFLYPHAFFQKPIPNYCHLLSCRGRLQTLSTLPGSSPSSFPYHHAEISSKCITHHTAHSAIYIPTLSHCLASLLWNMPTALFVTSPAAVGFFLPSSSSNPIFVLVFGASSHLSGILLPSFWYYSMSVPDLVIWFLLGCFVLLDTSALVRTSPSTLRLVIPWEVFHPSLVMGASPFRGIFKRL